MGQIKFKNFWYPALLILSLGNGFIQTSLNLVNELSIINVLVVALCIWVIIVLLSLEAKKARLHVKIYSGIIMLAGFVGLLSTLLLFFIDRTDTSTFIKTFNHFTSFVQGSLLYFYWDKSVSYENDGFLG